MRFKKTAIASEGVRHREERSDAAIHKSLIRKRKWIASLRSQ